MDHVDAEDEVAGGCWEGALRPLLDARRRVDRHRRLNVLQGALCDVAANTAERTHGMMAGGRRDGWRHGRKDG